MAPARGATIRQLMLAVTAVGLALGVFQRWRYCQINAHRSQQLARQLARPVNLMNWTPVTLTAHQRQALAFRHALNGANFKRKAWCVWEPLPSPVEIQDGWDDWGAAGSPSHGLASGDGASHGKQASRP